MIDTDRPQVTILRMRIACWITKTTNTHSEYVILIVFPRPTVVTRTRLNVTLYVHCLYGITLQTQWEETDRQVYT